MAIPRPLAEALEYLADLGWTEVRRPKEPGEQATGAVLRPDEPDEQATGAVLRREEPGERAGAKARSPDELGALATEAAVCRDCRLCETRKRVVFGSGDPHARLMLIGEAPGAEEDRQGLPFVGPAGDKLTEILRAIDLAREEVYIANIVKCRPPGNRDPQPDEVAACRRYLEGQIRSIRPAVLVALGRVAAQALLGTDDRLGALRGRWYEVQGVPTMVTYHPAALLRNSAYRRPTWEDVQQVRDRLNAAG
jgi:DNA polymerase